MTTQVKDEIKRAVRDQIPNINPKDMVKLEELDFDHEGVVILAQKYGRTELQAEALADTIDRKKEPTQRVKAPTFVAETNEHKPLTAELTPEQIAGGFVVVLLLLAGLFVLVLVLHSCNGRNVVGLRKDVATLRTEKADKSDVVLLVGTVTELAETVKKLSDQVDMKADKSDLEKKADKNDLVTKADKSDLDKKANKADLDKLVTKRRLAVVVLRLKDEEKKLDAHIAVGDKKEKATSASVPTHKVTYRHVPTYMDVYKPRPGKP